MPGCFLFLIIAILRGMGKYYLFMALIFISLRCHGLSLFRFVHVPFIWLVIQLGAYMLIFSGLIHPFSVPSDLLCFLYNIYFRSICWIVFLNSFGFHWASYKNTYSEFLVRQFIYFHFFWFSYWCFTLFLGWFHVSLIFLGLVAICWYLCIWRSWDLNSGLYVRKSFTSQPTRILNSPPAMVNQLVSDIGIWCMV